MADEAAQLIVEQVLGGRIEARYLGDGAPLISLRMGEDVLESAHPAPDAEGDGAHRLSLAIPASAINDGTTALTLHVEGQDAALATVLLMAGTPDEDDVQGQVAQLRAELDQVKAMLRRRLG